jgi:peptidoglycan/LPS O-acetylase OafA/YrhL
VTEASRDRLAPLTGLRFGAAFGILLFHFGAPLTAGAPAWVDRVRTGGYAWVGLFYVLSGFVLAWANPAPMTAAERRAFWLARFARIYPAYLLAFVLVAPFALERWEGGGHLAPLKAAVVAVTTLLLLQAWAPPIARLWNTPGWSTSVIAAFYAAFPFVAASLARRSRRGLAAAAVAAWGASLALPLLYLATRPDGVVPAVTWGEPSWLAALKFHPIARAGEFVCGVALGLLHRRGLRLRGVGAPAALLALGVAVAVLAWGEAPYVLVHNGLLVPLFAVAVLGLAPDGGPVGRALGSAPARALGDAAFALYALQEPLWLWARALAAPDRTAPASAGFVVAFALGASAIAVVVSRVLERPARRALRAALGAEHRSAPVAPPPAQRQSA